MLDRTEQASKSVGKRHQVGDLVLPIAFFGAAVAATFAWIAVMGWAIWRAIVWMFL